MKCVGGGTTVTTLEIDPLAKELGDRFQAAGHELYLVGGASATS